MQVQDFKDALINKNALALFIGNKKGGKSYLMLNFLRYALKNKVYDMYVLILLAYKVEATQAYDFKTQNKKAYLFLMITLLL